jgi:GNAT superfamily N-acetyltransferase
MPTEANPIFRQARSADIPAMSSIRLSVAENVLSDPRRVTHDMYESYLDAWGRGWVAEIGGEIVAFCYADSEKGAIWALFVSPRYEGQGLAKRLLTAAVSWLFEQGHGFVSLSTRADTRADRFYAMQGWQRSPLSETEVQYILQA